MRFFHLYCLVTFILCIRRLDVCAKWKLFLFRILDITCQLMCFDKVYLQYLMCHCKSNKLWLFGTVDETKVSLFFNWCKKKKNRLKTWDLLESVCSPSTLVNRAIKLPLSFIVLGLNSCFQQQPISNGKVCFKVQSRSFTWFEEEPLNTISWWWWQTPTGAAVPGSVPSPLVKPSPWSQVTD